MTEIEYLRDLRQVTEWRDGCVWKMKSLGLVWASDKPECYQHFTAADGSTQFYASVSTSVPWPHIRRKKGE